MRKDALVTQLLDSLPKNFSFYHLGEVQLETEAKTFLDWEYEKERLISSDQSAVVYQLTGEVNGSVFIMLAPDLDASAYSEMGNVIVSRMLEKLEELYLIQASLSSPRILAGKKLKETLEKLPPSIQGKVHHRTQHETISLNAFVSLIPTGGGNA